LAKSRLDLFLLSAALVAPAALHLAAQTGSPALIVLNKEDATLAVVNPATGTIVRQMPTGEGPHEVAVSDDGGTAFVSNYGGQTPGSTISVIDLSGRKPPHVVSVDPLRRPHGLAFFDGKLYFTAEVNRLIARYDPAADRIDWYFGTGQATTHMVLISPDGRRLVTANIGANTITLMERGANAQTWNPTVIPVGAGPEGIDLSPDGREIWTAHSRDGGVSVVDVASRKVVATLALGTKRSNRLKFTPDGSHVLITDLDAGELLVVDAATRREIKRLAVGRNPEGILMAPDGSRAYVAVNADNNLAVIDLETLEIAGRIATGAGPDGMAWVK
jgi:YVTN family beta-propeller protein